jgi:hypothetical protein
MHKSPGFGVGAQKPFARFRVNGVATPAVSVARSTPPSPLPTIPLAGWSWNISAGPLAAWLHGCPRLFRLFRSHPPPSRDPRYRIASAIRAPWHASSNDPAVRVRRHVCHRTDRRKRGAETVLLALDEGGGTDDHQSGWCSGNAYALLANATPRHTHDTTGSGWPAMAAVPRDGCVVEFLNRLFGQASDDCANRRHIWRNATAAATSTTSPSRS